MRGAGGFAFGIDIDRDRPGPGAQHHLTRRSRRTPRDSHALPCKGQHQRKQNGQDWMPDHAGTITADGHPVRWPKRRNPDRDGPGLQ